MTPLTWSRKFITLKSFTGQSLVEFALVLPFLAILFIGITDVGRLLVISHEMSASVREGAKYATETTTLAVDRCGKKINANQTAIQNDAVARTRRILTDAGLPGWAGGIAVSADVVWPPKKTGTTNYVLLDVQAQWNVPLLFGLFGPTADVRARSFGYVTEFDDSATTQPGC